MRYSVLDGCFFSLLSLPNCSVALGCYFSAWIGWQFAMVLRMPDICAFEAKVRWRKCEIVSLFIQCWHDTNLFFFLIRCSLSARNSAEFFIARHRIFHFTSINCSTLFRQRQLYASRFLGMGVQAKTQFRLAKQKNSISLNLFLFARKWIKKITKIQFIRISRILLFFQSFRKK